MYAVKEIFYTLQGEGFHAGRPAVFCRFAGCNLWSGREQDRATALCAFCDTDFVGTDGNGGGKFTNAASLAAAIERTWGGHSSGNRFVVLTGGEPLLQVDCALVNALHEREFECAVETNGTVEPPEGLDWICVSPKAGAPVRLSHADEVKLVFPQLGLDPADCEPIPAAHYFLQPCDDSNRDANTKAAIGYCLNNPRWRLSAQTHKYLGIR